MYICITIATCRSKNEQSTISRTVDLYKKFKLYVYIYSLLICPGKENISQDSLADRTEINLGC